MEHKHRSKQKSSKDDNPLPGSIDLHSFNGAFIAKADKRSSGWFKPLLCSKVYFGVRLAMICELKQVTHNMATSQTTGVDAFARYMTHRNIFLKTIFLPEVAKGHRARITERQYLLVRLR